jgi:hypothetical protein
LIYLDTPLDEFLEKHDLTIEDTFCPWCASTNIEHKPAISKDYYAVITRCKICAYETGLFTPRGDEAIELWDTII